VHDALQIADMFSIKHISLMIWAIDNGQLKLSFSKHHLDISIPFLFLCSGSLFHMPVSISVEYAERPHSNGKSSVCSTRRREFKSWTVSAIPSCGWFRIEIIFDPCRHPLFHRIELTWMSPAQAC
jgi:hypothetical protein